MLKAKVFPRARARGPIEASITSARSFAFFAPFHARERVAQLKRENRIWFARAARSFHARERVAQLKR